MKSSTLFFSLFLPFNSPILPTPVLKFIRDKQSVQFGYYQKVADQDADKAPEHIGKVNAIINQVLDERSSFDDTVLSDDMAINF
ncbi:MAG: hypothetical protein LBS44_04300 [Deltaproteobacteria bacterium]|jgi:flagellar biosynthesis/type III secretory pathway ATPase|nr:hypothetical protein [Deltaproteobacteria bacterium]